MADQSLSIEHLIDSLEELFLCMDEAYNRLAAWYDFSCEKCVETCCTIGFQHFTLLEFVFLSRGLRSLDSSEREVLLAKARQAAGLGDHGQAARCPLEVEGRCSLYDYRPMICRLHGLPHLLRHPHRGEFKESGCRVFRNIHTDPENRSLDRTPFYTEFARLEGEARLIFGTSRVPPRNVARMIVDALEHQT